MWGSPPIQVPKDVLCKWGARAIKEKPGFSLLPDRQSYEGPGTEFDPDLAQFIDTRALPEGKAWALRQSPSSCDVFEIDDGPHHYRATCNGSYGYVYMAAWKDK